MSAPAQVPLTPAAPLTRRIALTGLTVLTLINLLNYLDRYVVAALLTDLKSAHMNLSDTRLGALMSGFLIVYLCAAPVFGAIADRGSRLSPMAIGVLLWSLATGLSGFARNFLQLFAARAAVGIGEAAYGTIAPALLADYFVPANRGRVLAVFNMAIPVGAALGYVVGGKVDAAYGWRAAFFVAAVPGALLALWVLRLPDPRHGPTLPARGSARSRGLAHWLALYAALLRHAPYRFTVLGYAAYTFAVGGLAYWMPTFLQTARHVPAQQATVEFGGIVVVTGFVGTLAGGWLGDFWLRYSREGYLWMSSLVTVLAVPFALVALSAGSVHLYYPALVVAELLLFMSAGPINSAIINQVAPGERASAIALSVFLIHLLGDVPSPLAIGALSDASRSLATGVLIVPLAIAVSAALWGIAALASRRSSSGVGFAAADA
jgi:MFS transporter, Spinster family, sphingosine-1-phosphate transporter